MGFEQRQNARAFQFSVMEKGQPSRHFVVTADLGLFLANRVALQEGPTLSASKLAADLAKNFEGEHQLTADDLREHADAVSLAKVASGKCEPHSIEGETRTTCTAPAVLADPCSDFDY